MTRISDIANYLQARISGPAEGLIVRPESFAITQDSRRVIPGGIFVAIEGAQVDGNRFVDQATKRGASAIISENARPADAAGVWLEVADARVALARAAAMVYDWPSRRLALVGVTGTNGKTTTTYLVEAMMKAAGMKTAVMGTIGYRIGEETTTADFTTPEAPEIQDFLRRALAAGTTHAVMEVSSIALEMHRADELEFAVAAFTNLTQDHLDFHGTMEAYFGAKRKLFDGSLGRRPDHSVLNLDDPYGVALQSVCRGRVWTYALDAPAEIAASQASFGLTGLRFTASTPAGEIEIDSPLVGRPHAYNILCATGIGLALGIPPETIASGIRQCPGVAGRFERVSGPEDDITVIVDYAHTPDALANVLRTIDTVRGGPRGAAGRLITVFGCGGDRDRTKRPLMGEEAGRWSDQVIVTSDNPRSEDPLLIMNDIRVGLDRVGKNYEMIVDRQEAIFQAITLARPGDIVLLAGKGHETYQILASGRIHFDDREVAREALAERRNFKGRFPNGRLPSA